MQVSEQLLFLPAADGTRLAITLYRPAGDGPFATLLEALPYRMNDVTSSYADGYVRFATEGNFAVVRMDLRGTGNSAGVLGDEYPDIERSDLRDVIEWIAAQPWSNGKVGMLGTSYSGSTRCTWRWSRPARTGRRRAPCTPPTTATPTTCTTWAARCARST